MLVCGALRQADDGSRMGLLGGVAAAAKRGLSGAGSAQALEETTATAGHGEHRVADVLHRARSVSRAIDRCGSATG